MVLNSEDDVFFGDEIDGVVKEIDPPYTSVTRTIASVATNIAIDSHDNLWIPNAVGPSIEEIAPPHTGAPIVTITNAVPVNFPSAVIHVFASPYTGPAQTLATDVRAI